MTDVEKSVAPMPEEQTTTSQVIVDAKSSGQSDYKTGWLLCFVLTVGLGSLQFGYMNGNFSNLQDDFAVIFSWDSDEQKSMSAIITAIC
jgi:hypothetical protein